ncbi:hypothetical protein P5673_007445, partial [Acropora cervicornis]
MNRNAPTPVVGSRELSTDRFMVLLFKTTCASVDSASFTADSTKSSVIFLQRYIKDAIRMSGMEPGSYKTFVSSHRCSQNVERNENGAYKSQSPLYLEGCSLNTEFMRAIFAALLLASALVGQGWKLPKQLPPGSVTKQTYGGFSDAS